MTDDRHGAFDLSSTCVQLRDGPEAIAIPVTPDFWQRIAQRPELHEGRLVTVSRQTADWPHWEMHPAGEEIVYLLSGAVDLILDEPDGERTVTLAAGLAVIVPRGIWHRAVVHAAGEALFITRGAGTQHRPR